MSSPLVGRASFVSLVPLPSLWSCNPCALPVAAVLGVVAAGGPGRREAPLLLLLRAAPLGALGGGWGVLVLDCRGELLLPWRSLGSVALVCSSSPGKASTVLRLVGVAALHSSEGVPLAVSKPQSVWRVAISLAVSCSFFLMRCSCSSSRWIGDGRPEGCRRVWIRVQQIGGMRGRWIRVQQIGGMRGR